MKDFSNFINLLDDNCLNEINTKVISKISEQENKIDFKNDIEYLSWKIKAHSTVTTIELLKKYHEWSNS